MEAEPREYRNATNTDGPITTETSHTGETPTEVYVETIIANIIWIYVSPILILTGTVGNLLSAMLMSSRRLRNSVTSLYFRVLAFADTLVLWSGLFRQWMSYAFALDVRALSTFSCRFHTLLVYWSFHFAVWVLVSVAVERFVSVCLPLRARDIYSKKKASIALLVLGVFFIVVNLHWTISLEMKHGHSAENSRVQVFCSFVGKGWTYYSLTVFPWIDLMFYTVLPFTLMIASNLAIIFKVVLNRLNRNRILPSGDSSQPGAPSHGRNKAMSSMTMTLLSVSFTFLFLSIPVCIFLALPQLSLDPATPYAQAQWNFWWAFTNLLSYLNHGVNFLLYCLTSPTFRREFLVVIGRRKLPLADGSVSLKATGNSIT